MSATIPAVTLYDEHIPWNEVYRKRMVLMMVCTHEDWFIDGDLDWVARNYHVWEAFELEANKVWDRGRRHYSARTIGEYLRHESAIREEPNEHGFKVNDKYWPSLGRLYGIMYPERYSFFEFRHGVSSRRAL